MKINVLISVICYLLLANQIAGSYMYIAVILNPQLYCWLVTFFHVNFNYNLNFKMLLT